MRLKRSRHSRPLRPALRNRFEEGVRQLGGQLEAAKQVLVIPAKLDPVFWAEDTIHLSKVSSAEGGAKIKLYGYQKALIRLSVGGKKNTVVMKGTRNGITQAYAVVYAYHVGYEGSPCGLWLPDEAAAKKYYKKVWEPMWSDSPKLSSLVRKPLKGEVQDTWNEMTYLNGGAMSLKYATTHKQFSGDTQRKVGGDEAARWQISQGGDDGNYWDLLRERFRTFYDGASYVWSSPRTTTREGKSFYEEYLAGDQHKYYQRCPHCDGVQHLEWGAPEDGEVHYGFKYALNDKGHVEDAWYVCKHNGCIIRQSDRRAMDQEAGNAIYAEDDPTPFEERLGLRPTAISDRPDLQSVHLPGFISLHSGALMKTLCQEWVTAVRAIKTDPSKMQVFMNNVLGLPFDGVDADKPIEVGSFEQKRPKPFVAEIPQWTVQLVAYYDTQKGWADEKLKRPPRHEMMVLAVGPQDECAIVGYFVLDDHAPWSAGANAQLDEIVFRDWRKPDGTAMRILMCGYDAGYDQTRALEFRRAQHRFNIFRPMKGENEDAMGPKAPIVAKAKSDDARANDLLRIGTRLGKEKADRLLKVDLPGPGHIHIPSSMALAHPGFFKGLFSERHVLDSKGADYWTKSKWHANEVWDCLVGCLATIEWCKLQWPSRVGRAIDEAVNDTPRVRYEGRDKSVMAPIVEAIGMREILKTPGTSIVPVGSNVVPRAANANRAPARRGGVIGGARFAMRGRG